MPEGGENQQAKLSNLENSAAAHTCIAKLAMRFAEKTAHRYHQDQGASHQLQESDTMNMIRYQPWRSLGDLHSELSSLFEGAGPAVPAGETTACDWVPAVDVREETDRFVVHADLPGVDPSDIEVTMENGVLTVRGERKTQASTNEQGYRRVERSTGYFYRRFALPDTVDSEGVKASGHNGVLEIAIPKQAKVQPRRIEIEAS